MAVKPHKFLRRTVTGRIVYNRPKHLYTTADIFRIIKNVSARMQMDLLQTVAYFIKEIILWAIAKIRKDEAENYFIEQRIQSFVSNLVFQVINSLLELFFEIVEDPFESIKELFDRLKRIWIR